MIPTLPWAYLRTLSSQMLSKLFVITTIRRTDLTDNLSYIELLRDENKDRGGEKNKGENITGVEKVNLIIIRGGCVWDKDIPSYIKPFYYLLSSHYRIFLPEIGTPVCNLQLHNEVHQIVGEVKRDYPDSPIILLGMSMGGTHTINYMYHHFDECCLYINACSPLDLYRMSYVMTADPFYRFVVKNTMKRVGVSTYEELYSMASLDVDTFNNQMKNFSMMMCEIGKWSDEKKGKFVCFLASDDTLTRGFFQDRDYYNFPLEIHHVYNSSHCCYNISIAIINYLNSRV